MNEKTSVKLKYTLNGHEFIELKRLYKVGVFKEDVQVELFEDEVRFSSVDNNKLQKRIDDFIDVFVKVFPLSPIIYIKRKKDSSEVKIVYLGSRDPIIQDYGPKNRSNLERKLSFDPNPIIEKKDKIFLFGKSLIVGEFSKKFNQEDIVLKSKGLFHEVILLSDGSLVCRGSNENGQLNFGEIKGVKNIVCGRFFTAFLLFNQTVESYGFIQSSVPSVIKEIDDLSICPGYKFTDREEDEQWVCNIDEVPVDLEYERDDGGRVVSIWMRDSEKKCVGRMWNYLRDEGGLNSFSSSGFVEGIQAASINYQFVVCAQMCPGMSDIQPSVVNRKIHEEKNKYKVIPVKQWHSLVELIANYDGLIGLTEKGQNLAFGHIL